MSSDVSMFLSFILGFILGTSVGIIAMALNSNQKTEGFACTQSSIIDGKAECVEMEYRRGERGEIKDEQPLELRLADEIRHLHLVNKELVDSDWEPVYRCDSCRCIYLVRVSQCDCTLEPHGFDEGMMTFSSVAKAAIAKAKGEINA